MLATTYRSTGCHCGGVIRVVVVRGFGGFDACGEKKKKARLLVA